MKRIVLLLIALLAVGCSKSEDKQEDFSQYKLNVPEWLVGEWKYSTGFITHDFGFSKNDYLLSGNGKSFFEDFWSRLVKEGEYSYMDYKGYYFISYATQTKKYFKYSFEMKEKKCSFEFNGTIYNLCNEENKNDRDIRRIYEEVTEYGTTIKKIYDDEYTYKKVK
ncbi:hypothetical protein HW278_10215 [Capnocytophaga sp. oral taxon 902]|jgi:lipoprotein|uniref:hypothetical protein n=1 Tax=Capnocytophaga sp. oral taxon 902 TaxID=2748316 RepID=UPI0015B88DA3|nr:hypothetical protein [Capnocytophaga sp. oral taxon 902]QLF51033.1 hypothetical protein HW278_10215 [Capnocytophaga sp. oral taxon 902]